MRIHQEHANVFLTVYCPQLKSTLVGINYQMFLDVVVKCVIGYQNSKLVKREYVPGRQCKWNDVTLFTQYIDPMGVQNFKIMIAEFCFQKKKGILSNILGFTFKITKHQLQSMIFFRNTSLFFPFSL